MNTSGCELNFARDDFFISDYSGSIPPCYFSIPVYYTFMSIFSTILFLVAVVRTSLVRHMRLKKKKRIEKFSVNAMIPLLTVAASWGSFIVIMLMMIIPATQGATQTNMTFLLGWQCLCFNFLAERWLRKLIKLGGKIIAPKSRIGDSSSSNGGDHEIKVLEKLKRTDNMLKVLETIIITGIIFQFICFCILSMVFPSQKVWLNIGIGMEGYEIFFSMFALVWQYHRCSQAIKASSTVVRGILDGKQRPLDNVNQKFRKHQLILMAFGLSGSMVFLLWSVNVIPISYLLLIATSLFDSGTNCGILFTFLKRKNSRDPQTQMVSGSTFQNEITKYEESRGDKSVLS
jgi:hypothetical protein